MIKTIKVPCVQVHLVWDAVKFAAVSTDLVEEEFQQPYCNQLLIDLLAGNKHVFVALNSNREIIALGIVMMTMGSVTGRKRLKLSNVYAWEKTTSEDKIEFFSHIASFAKTQGCYDIETSTYNPKMQELAMKLNPASEQRQYLFTV